MERVVTVAQCWNSIGVSFLSINYQVRRRLGNAISSDLNCTQRGVVLFIEPSKDEVYYASKQTTDTSYTEWTN